MHRLATRKVGFQGREGRNPHSAQVAACAVVSMPAMKKMLSSLQSRAKGSGPPCSSLTRSRCPPMEGSSSAECSPLHLAESGISVKNARH